jgi:hypothetical protein
VEVIGRAFFTHYGTVSMSLSRALAATRPANATQLP